jgi:hypothetical protein
VRVSVAIYRIDERTRAAKIVYNDNTKSDVCKELGLKNPEQLISFGHVYLGEQACSLDPCMREILASFYMSGYMTGQTEKAQDICKRLGLE